VTGAPNGPQRPRLARASTATLPSSPPPQTKKAIGDRAERAASAWLVARGLQLVASNVRVGRLEIDLVVRDGAVIVFVEVRTRGPGAWTGALASVDAKKRARLRAAGERLWRDRFARDATIERARFDVAAVELLPDGGANVEHIKAAF
jgi:putative endonuclease